MVGPLNSLYQLHLAKGAILVSLPKDSGETEGGNHISTKRGYNQP